jgi:hypothetical protein
MEQASGAGENIVVSYRIGARLVLRDTECPGPTGDTCVCTLDQGIWECD